MAKRSPSSKQSPKQSSKRSPKRSSKRSPKRASRPDARSHDVALILNPTDDNEGIQILRQRAADRPLELGILRPLREGRPIDGEVVSLRPREGTPLFCDVKVELEDPHADRGTSDGPPQVATDRYRRGWEAIWGQRALPGTRPN
jgi:hypothetical protein